MNTMSSPSRALMVVPVVMLVMMLGGCQAASSSKDYKQDPRNISHCDGASGMGSFDWSSYRGRWYVKYVSAPLSGILRDVQGYAVDIDASSIEPNAKDRKFRDATVERKEILVMGDSRKCNKRNWVCYRERGSSETFCKLNSDGIGVIEQSSAVIYTDYITTAAVYRETYINGNLQSRQINLMVRDPGMEPDDPSLLKALKSYCGYYAANPGSEFYKSIPTSGNACFLP